MHNADPIAAGSPRRPLPPVDVVQPHRQRRAHQQIIMSPAGRNTSPQQLPRSRQDHLRAGGQLMAVAADYGTPFLGELLEAPTVEQPDEGPAHFRGRLPSKCIPLSMADLAVVVV